MAEGDGRTVSGYGLDRLDRRWRADWPGIEVHTASGCGPALLCVAEEPGATRALSRATGEQVWRAEVEWPRPSGDLLLATAGYAASELPQPMVLLDPASGAVRHELGRWVVSGHLPRGGIFLTYVRPGVGRAWFGILEPGATLVRTLATASGVQGECRLSGDGAAVACRRRDGTVGVWMIPSSEW